MVALRNGGGLDATAKPVGPLAQLVFGGGLKCAGFMMTAAEKSKMRIGRGLFRLWLVLSVFWIAAVGTVVTWQNWPDDDWVPVAKTEPPQALAPRLRECPSTTPDHPMVVDPVSGKCRPLKFDELPDEAKVPNNALPLEPAPWLIKEREQRAAALKLGVALALVPPVLVLVIGSALGWALKGFR